jgi:hypothetical protein
MRSLWSAVQLIQNNPIIDITMTYSKIIIASLAAGLAVVQAQAAIISGDSIFVDFGEDTSTGNENTISSTLTDALSIADAIRFSDGAATGVGIAVAKTGGGWTQANTSAGTGPNALNTTDLSVFGDALGINNGGTATMSITFTGLSDVLTYDLTGGVTANSNYTTGWTIAGSPRQVSDATASGGYISFTDLTSTGGTLTITLDRDTKHFAVSQLQLTAIPEPGTYALLGGLLALGYVMVRRRR